MKKKYNIPDYVIELARDLRKKQTTSEKIIWEIVRDRRLKGYKFRRQQPVGRYIVDFLSIEAKLAIEIDGSVHNNTKEYDDEKDAFLKSAGFSVLRLPAKLVEQNIEEAVEMIINELSK